MISRDNFIEELEKVVEISAKRLFQAERLTPFIPDIPLDKIDYERWINEKRELVGINSTANDFLKELRISKYRIINKILSTIIKNSKELTDTVKSLILESLLTFNKSLDNDAVEHAIKLLEIIDEINNMDPEPTINSILKAILGEIESDFKIPYSNQIFQKLDLRIAYGKEYLTYHKLLKENYPKGLNHFNIKHGIIDIIVYVALTEEFKYVYDEFATEMESFELDNFELRYFVVKIFSPMLKRDFNLVLVPGGNMGNTYSSAAASVLIDRFDPKNLVVLGIAGTIDDDLEPGDVFIPSVVHEYFANSEVAGEKNIEFNTSGKHFKSNGRLLKSRFGLFNITDSTIYNEWKEKALDNANRLNIDKIIKKIKEISTELKIKFDFKLKNNLVVGDDRVLASGPTVGKSIVFANWIKKQIDRKVSAIEMESAGVYEAAETRIKMPRKIAIRGISDFADVRKKLMEKEASTAFRELATRNSTSLLIAAIKAGFFGEEGKLDKPHQPVN